MYYDRDRRMEDKRLRDVSEVAKGMLAFPSGRLIETNVDVDIWRYR